MAYQEYNPGDSNEPAAGSSTASTPAQPSTPAPSGWSWKFFGELFDQTLTSLGPQWAIVPTGYDSITAWLAANPGKNLAAPAQPSTGFWQVTWLTAQGQFAGYRLVGAADVDLPELGPEIEIRDGQTATLGPGGYVMRFDLNVGKNGIVQWRLDGSGWLVVPAGKTLILANRIKAFEQQFRGLLGFLQVNDANGSIYYRKATTVPSGLTAEGTLATFNAMLAEASGRLRSQLKSGAQLTGDWQVTEPTLGILVLQWPLLDSPGLGEFFGLTGPGGFFTAAGAWLAKWWWVLVLAAVLFAGFVLLPYLILLLARVIEAWQRVGALL